MPLNMPGTTLSLETDDSACQERCKRTSGCVHFSYYVQLGHCHLQSRRATLMPGQVGWISGPASCSGAPASSSGGGGGSESRRRSRDGCFKEHSTYMPMDMIGVTPAVMSSEVLCQDACRSHSRCDVFTYETLSGLCHLQARAKATLLKNKVLMSVTGPAWCTSVDIARGNIRRFDEGEGPIAASPKSVFGMSAVVSATALLLAAVLGVSACRGGRAGPRMRDEAEDEAEDGLLRQSSA